MPRKRSAAPSLVAPGIARFLQTAVYDSQAARDAGENGLEYFLTVRDSHKLRELWALVRDELLGTWIKSSPGCRPWAWWAFTAPREPLQLVAGRLWREDDRTAAHRRRVGGIGDPQHEVMGCSLTFRFGLPTLWVEPWMVSEFPRSSPDLYAPGWARAIDPTDPPQFESESTYLERHGLLTDAERRRLPADAFEPETLDVADDDAAA